MTYVHDTHPEVARVRGTLAMYASLSGKRGQRYDEALAALDSLLARLEAAERERDAVGENADSTLKLYEAAEAENERLRDRLQAITEWKPRDGYMAVHIARAALAARTEEPPK